jgi:hypothetical protein
MSSGFSKFFDGMGDAADLLKNGSIKLTVVNKGDSASVDMAILDDGDNLASFKITSKTAKAKKVSVPSDKNVIEATDEDDLVEYVQSVNMDDWIKNLESADVPSEVTDILEDVNDGIEDVEDMEDLEDLVYEIMYEYFY